MDADRKKIKNKKQQAQIKGKKTVGTNNIYIILKFNDEYFIFE